MFESCFQHNYSHVNSFSSALSHTLYCSISLMSNAYAMLMKFLLCKCNRLLCLYFSDLCAIPTRYRVGFFRLMNSCGSAFLLIGCGAEDVLSAES